jgi:hypothetical protein
MAHEKGDTKEFTLLPEMVELPVHQLPDFRLQGCTRGSLDCRGRVLCYMKFHDVEEQFRLSTKYLWTRPSAQPARAAISRVVVASYPRRAKRLVAAEIRAFCLPGRSRGCLVID